jgi:hypothetical protein
MAVEGGQVLPGFHINTNCLKRKKSYLLFKKEYVVLKLSYLTEYFSLLSWIQGAQLDMSK